MGWVAAAAVTLSACYLVYRYQYVYTNKHASKLEVELPTEHGCSKDRDTQKTVDGETEHHPSEHEPDKALDCSTTPLLQVQEVKSRGNEMTAGNVETFTPKSTSSSLMPPPSSQRPTRSSSPPRLKPPSFGTMPAPPKPANGMVRPPPSAAASLRVPQTKALPNAAFAPGTSTLGVPTKKSRKVMLQPGYSPLDWAALTSNPKSQLRGKDASSQLMRVTPSRLTRQTGRKGKDAWTVYQGKVYNITPFLPFHPGGEAELMRGVGRDAAKLFMEVHPWVNWDAMLGECLVGILVSESEGERNTNSGGLDDMD